MEPTTQQLEARKKAALALEQGIPLRNGLPVREPLTSEAFEPQEEIEFETDTSTPFTSASSIQLPTFELTEEQKRQQEIVEGTITEQEKLKGEETFRAEQRAKFVDPEQEKVFKDLTSQLKGLQAEELAIPIQLQQENVGLGRTRAASAVIQADRLRENAIKALTVSATLEATRGNLSFALDQVDRAVAAKYDPIKKTIEVNLANLDLISKSPLATNEEKKEAARVIDEEKKRNKAVEKEEKVFEETEKARLEYAGIADAETSNEMKKAKNAFEVKQIAKRKGLKTLAEQKVEADAEQQAFENKIKLRTVVVAEANAGLARRKDLLELAEKGDANAIKELGYDPKNLPITTEKIKNYEEQKSFFKRDIGIIDNALQNDVGLQNSSGLLRGGVSGAFLEAPLGIVSAPFSIAARNNFLADADYIVKNLTFDKIAELAAKGVKLTPISEKELQAMGAASNVLVSSAQYDNAGNLTGFRISESKVKELLRDIGTRYQNAFDDIDVALTLSEADKKEIINR